MTPEILSKIRMLVDVVRQEKEGKPPTKKQMALLEKLDENNWKAVRHLETFSFASMEACEGATGIPKAMQQFAKTNGAYAAFPGSSRVQLMPLLRWIFSKASEGKTDWGRMGVEIETKLKQVKLDAEIGATIEVEEAKQVLSDFAAVMFGQLKRLVDECPRDLEMRDKAHIKAAMQEKYRQALEAERTALAKLEKKPQKEKVDA